MQANLRKVLVAVALITPAPSAFADVIADWNEKAIAFVTPRMTPPAAQRVVAMVQVAMFDAVNSIERRYRPYLVQLPAPAAASKEAAAAAAAGSVLAGLNPQTQAELKAATTAYLSNIPDGDAKSEGIRLGEVVAGKILEARAKDGADAADAYRPKAKPGVYVPTPITVASMWPNVKPFAMTSPSQFRPEPPIALHSEQWASDYNEIKDLGATTSSKRSAKQTEDARFWLITGPQSTDPVARQLAAVKGMNVIDNARFMALTAVALADAYIAVMDAKYHYEFWRPITAIRNGDTDDNPATERDANLAADRQHAHASGISLRTLHWQRGLGRRGRGGIRHSRRTGNCRHQFLRSRCHASMDQSSRLCRRGGVCPHLGGLPLQVLGPRRAGHGIQDRPIRGQQRDAAGAHRRRALIAPSARLARWAERKQRAVRSSPISPP